MNGGDTRARSKQEPRQRDPCSPSCGQADTRDRAGSAHKPTSHRRDGSEFCRKDCCRVAGVPGLSSTRGWLRGSLQTWGADCTGLDGGCLWGPLAAERAWGPLRAGSPRQAERQGAPGREGSLRGAKKDTCR